MRTAMVGALMALGIFRAAHAAAPTEPDAGAERPDAEMLRDLDMLEDPDYARDSEVARQMPLLERLRILEVLRLLEGPPPAAPARSGNATGKERR